jgi:cytochrome c biogenesis protein CcmG, thiol:disulfide interchange protein DsbE
MDPSIEARRPTTVRYRAAIIGAGVLILAALAASFLRTGSGDVRFAGDLRVGGTLEQLELPALMGPGVVAYENFAQRPLVINFFASWCPSCIAEMPAFERVHRDLGDRVGFLGVSQSDPPDASIALVNRTGISYPTAIDRDGAFFRATGGLGMPTTIFVRPDGEIADIWVGALDTETLERLIADSLGEG